MKINKIFNFNFLILILVLYVLCFKQFIFFNFIFIYFTLNILNLIENKIWSKFIYYLIGIVLSFLKILDLLHYCNDDNFDLNIFNNFNINDLSSFFMRIPILIYDFFNIYTYINIINKVYYKPYKKIDISDDHFDGMYIKSMGIDGTAYSNYINNTNNTFTKLYDKTFDILYNFVFYFKWLGKIRIIYSDIDTNIKEIKASVLHIENAVKKDNYTKLLIVNDLALIKKNLNNINSNYNIFVKNKSFINTITNAKEKQFVIEEFDLMLSKYKKDIKIIQKQLKLIVFTADATEDYVLLNIKFDKIKCNIKKFEDSKFLIDKYPSLLYYSLHNEINYVKYLLKKEDLDESFKLPEFYKNLRNIYMYNTFLFYQRRYWLQYYWYYLPFKENNISRFDTYNTLCIYCMESKIKWINKLLNNTRIIKVGGKVLKFEIENPDYIIKNGEFPKSFYTNNTYYLDSISYSNKKLVKASYLLLKEKEQQEDDRLLRE